AEATISEGAPVAKARVGDVFQLDRWVAPDEDALRVYFPRPTPTRAEIGAVVRALEPLRKMAGLHWIDDPTEAPPNYVLSWTGAEWVISPPGAAPLLKLGARPATVGVAQAMHK